MRLTRSSISRLNMPRKWLRFLWGQKLWWLIPMVTVLLLFGLLLFFAQSSGLAPFLYPIFERPMRTSKLCSET